VEKIMENWHKSLANGTFEKNEKWDPKQPPEACQHLILKLQYFLTSILAMGEELG
jgi:hypothetical protein